MFLKKFTKSRTKLKFGITMLFNPVLEELEYIFDYIFSVP
jgi:hypothetical protein